MQSWQFTEYDTFAMNFQIFIDWFNDCLFIFFRKFDHEQLGL